jgi:electron transfer flavoprotein beta subunit
VRAAATLGGTAVALTSGTTKAKQSLKDALSRGPDEACYVNAEEAAKADGAATARVLAAAVRKIDGASLVICGEGASNTFARQTGPRVGALLDWPVITSVTGLKLDGNALIAVRRLEDSMETVRCELPAVVAVLPEINAAPIPGLKAVLSAGKKPVTEIKAGDLGIALDPKATAPALKGYTMDRKNILFSQGEAADKVKELAVALRKEGVL